MFNEIFNQCMWIYTIFDYKLKWYGQKQEALDRSMNEYNNSNIYNILYIFNLI